MVLNPKKSARSFLMRNNQSGALARRSIAAAHSGKQGTMRMNARDVGRETNRGIQARAAVKKSTNGSKPKYTAVANTILRAVEMGRWKPGDQLPSESELAEKMHVSLGTVQRALKVLTDQGLVLRHHGRGTFVGTGRAPDENLRHFRFLREGSRELLPVVSRVLSIEKIREQGPWAEFLGREDSYVRLLRILSVGGEFELFSEMYLLGEKFKDLLKVKPDDLGERLFDHTLQHADIAPRAALVVQLATAACMQSDPSATQHDGPDLAAAGFHLSRYSGDLPKGLCPPD